MPNPLPLSLRSSRYTSPDDLRSSCHRSRLKQMGYAESDYAGKPVIASPVGANVQVVRHGVNGFLAKTTEEWTDALRRLAADPDLRLRMGAAARQTVQDGYSVAAIAPRLAAILARAAKPF